MPDVELELDKEELAILYLCLNSSEEQFNIHKPDFLKKNDKLKTLRQKVKEAISRNKIKEILLKEKDKRTISGW